MALLSRRRNAERNADGTMSLMEHLYELRRRLFFAVLFMLMGTVVGFIWYTVGIPAIHLQPLNKILIQPYCSVSQAYRLALNTDQNHCVLLATTPFSFLEVRLKAALLVGAVISSPGWLYQLWSFVNPALYSREKKYTVTFVLVGGFLFLAGAGLAYFVIGEGLKVLLSFAGNTGIAALSPDSYFSFLIAMLIIFGLSFEVPLLLVLLNFAGVIKGEKLAKVRRYAIFGMVVLAALVVPGNDPVTMSSLAVSLAVLYEVAVQISKFHDKRKAKQLVAEGFAGLSDDEASPMLPSTGPEYASTDPEPYLPPASPTPLTRDDLGDVT